MNGWLLDTNVLSELRRKRPEPQVVKFVTGEPLDRLYVSTVTLAEIRFGIEILDDAARRAELKKWLAVIVRPLFERRVLEVTEDILLEWRMLIEEGRKSGHTYSQPDLFIAATARHYGLTVATRNINDYARAGTPVFNPWTNEAER